MFHSILELMDRVPKDKTSFPGLMERPSTLTLPPASGVGHGQRIKEPVPAPVPIKDGDSQPKKRGPGRPRKMV